MASFRFLLVSTSHRPSFLEPESSSGSRSCRTTEQSPSLRSQRHQSRGRRYGRHPTNEKISNRQHMIDWTNRRTMAKSPRIVPGEEASGLVAPSRTRPVLTASLPSQTMAQTGPLPISIDNIYQFFLSLVAFFMSLRTYKSRGP